MGQFDNSLKKYFYESIFNFGEILGYENAWYITFATCLRILVNAPMSW